MDNEMKMKKKWRSLVPFLVILTIILPYISTIALSMPDKAEAITTGEVIFDDENYGRVEVSYEEKEATVAWTIDYQKYQSGSSNDVQRLMKLKLDKAATGVGTVNNANAPGMTMQADGWLVENDFSATSKGQLLAEVPKEEATLAIDIQLDQQQIITKEIETVVEMPVVQEATEEETEEVTEPQAVTEIEQVTEEVITENILSTTQQGPHQVTAQLQVEEPVESETAVEDEVAEEATEATDVEEEVAIDENVILPAAGLGRSTAEPELPPVTATKRARLATEDANGVSLTPQEAWDQRLYEITFDLEADAPLIHGAADIVFIVDGSSSANGGTRAGDVINAITYLAEQLGEAADNINIAVLPALGPSGHFNATMGNIVTHFEPMTYWKDQDYKNLNTQVSTILTHRKGSKDALSVVTYANNLLKDRDNQAFVVFTVGDEITDSEDVGTLMSKSSYLSKENTFAAQTDGDSSHWTKYSVTTEENYFYEGKEDEYGNPIDIGQIIPLMIDSLISQIKIEKIQLQDVISPYFKVEKNDIGQLTPHADGTSSFVIEDIELEGVRDPEGGEIVHYSWSTTILVKAKENFVGADVVPTNIGAESGITIPGVDTLQQFTVVGEENEEGVRPEYIGLSTPYVDVKLLPIIGPDTKETILLNQQAMPRPVSDNEEGPTIFDGWKDKVTWETDFAGELLVVEPAFSMGEFIGDETYSKDHVFYPESRVEYKAPLTAKAGIASEDDGASEYVTNYGTTRFDNTTGLSNYPGNNQQSADATHTVEVLTAELEIDKTLDGNELPEGFKATFKLQLTGLSEEGKTENPVASYSNEISIPGEANFESLGVGTYKLTERHEHGGVQVPISWTINVRQDPLSGDPKFSILVDIDGLEGVSQNVVQKSLNSFELTINNLTKALTLDVLKLDEHSNLPIENVEFEIFDKENLTTAIASGTSTTDGKVTFNFEENQKLQIGKSYQLRETIVPEKYIGLIDTIDFTVDINGDISITESPYVSVSNSDSSNSLTVSHELTVLNKPKGQLPSTGGQGRKASMIAAATLIIFAIGTTVYYVYRNRKGAK
ncbi:SpaA isopeptide-forming pilin-related protein [Enterococcus massiliensis]|uniref:SpaA isopeptide-forming pilin-related protein n=1 Tax=Enterococcus massiliensis TaxID=1640685 RepID=UPI000B316CE3|nr:SpaA isopeptide-forming pilin-related protein [Enterococcus massiliensis]